MNYIELNSVGSLVTNEGIVFPIDCSEAPENASEAEEMSGVHLLDVDSEWFNSLSRTDLLSLFEFVANDLVGDLGDIDLGHWISTIHGEWYQVNVIDCTEGSNWTEPYGVEEDGYLLSDDDDECVILHQSQYSEVI